MDSTFNFLKPSLNLWHKRQDYFLILGISHSIFGGTLSDISGILTFRNFVLRDLDQYNIIT